MEKENKENAATAPTEAATQNFYKPSLQEQIDYLKKTIDEAQQDKEAVLEHDDSPLEDREAFAKDMDKHITFFRAICENIIALRNLEEAERREKEKEADNG